MESKLPSYSVIIATYNRLDCLKESLKCILQQTPLPEKIIIINASPDFEYQEKEILSAIFIPEHIEFIHKKSARPSLASQRNQGIELATSEKILFFIDDDSFMFPFCAKKILEIYNLDSEKKVAGIQPSLASTPPGFSAASARTIKKKENATSGKLARLGEKYLTFIWRHLFMMASDLHLIPYDGIYHSGHSIFTTCIPSTSSYPTVPLFHGCRMSFRREVVKLEKFDPDLVRYSAAEDLDLSYRASRHGLLLECPDARLYHEPAASGRLSRLQATHMAWLNIAIFIRKHSTNFNRDRRKYYIYSVRRLIAETAKDIASKRFSLPQAIGIYRGFQDGIKVFNSSESDLSSNIQLLQSQFVG